MSYERFTINSTSIVANRGWAAKCLFINDCENALVLYAHRALTIVDCKSGHYEKNSWDLGEGVYIKYESILIEDDYVFFWGDNGKIYRFDIGNRILDRFAQETQDPDQRTSLQYHCGNHVLDSLLAYITDDSIIIKTMITNVPVKPWSRIPVDTDPNSKLLFHPSGKYIVYMNSDFVTMYRIHPFEEIWQIKPFEWFTKDDYWEFSNDGEYFLICPYESSIKVCNAYTGRPLALFKKGNDDTVFEAHLSEGNKRIISCSGDKMVRVWNLEKALMLSKNGACYTPDQYSSGPDMKALLASIEGFKQNTVSNVSPSPDFKKAIAFTKFDSTFYYLDLENSNILCQHKFEHPIDDFKVTWNGTKANLFVAENTEGFRFDSAIRPVPPYIRISELDIF